MKPILFKEDETAFASNGLGRIDALRCEVTEERNGQYELEMDVSIEAPHFADIVEGRILLARHDDTIDRQPFEIYRISKPLSGVVTVFAHHISYRTEKVVVTPFSTQGSIPAAINAIQTHVVGSSQFTLWTDKSTAGSFSVTKPAALRSLLGGSSGSLLDVYGTGEYEWDRYTIKLHARRGRDTNVVLRYGKDITDLKKTTDMSSVWTGVVPFWTGVDADNADSDVIVMLPEVVLYSDAADDYSYRMIIPLDLSAEWMTKPTEAQLRARAQAYVDANGAASIPTSIDVSFVATWQLEEYEDVAALQRLSLCDTLTVQYTRLGVNGRAKIVKTVYDVLNEKYVSMTIGETRPNLGTTISGGLSASLSEIQRTMASRQGVAAQIASSEAVMQAAITDATDKITGGTGGHVVLQMNADGKPSEILVMDTESTATAVNVLRINTNGIGFSANGINGPYRTAWTLDGGFVASFITSGTMVANRIAGGLLTDLTGDNSWDLTTGAMNFETLSWTAAHSSMTSDGYLTCEGAEIRGELKTTFPDTYGYTNTFWFHDGQLSGYGVETSLLPNPDDPSDISGIPESSISRFEIGIHRGQDYMGLDTTNGSVLRLRANNDTTTTSTTRIAEIYCNPRDTVHTTSVTLNANVLELGARSKIYVMDGNGTYQEGVTAEGWVKNTYFRFVNGVCTYVYPFD